MNTTYHSRYHANHRKMFELLVEQMQPWSVTSEDYEAALLHLNRADTEDERKLRPGTIRTFGTCLACLGDGREDNPRFDGESNEPEDVDCEMCRGVGLVQIIDKPIPVQDADDVPF